MARRRHVIESALDFARMPALARSSVTPPIPADIVEIMRIAAASPKACQEACKATGESAAALIEAARFYLQQHLFRPDADAHRILGLQPGASRATARTHMRWLLQWLHPDRNDGLEAVYAERVVKAWRELSGSTGAAIADNHGPIGYAGDRSERSAPFRVPWIKTPVKGVRARGPAAYLTFAVWVIPGMLFALMALWSAAFFLGFGPPSALVFLP
jgi:hypothetical protein